MPGDPAVSGPTGPLRVARRLVAPAPGWTAEADVIVVGSGIAGLTTALRLRRRVPRVLLVTKTVLSSGSTLWAQGGVAAALADTDSPDEHLQDTLVAGAGLCDEEAVRALVTEGPARIRDLIALGAHFDTGADGEVLLTREGGHHADRIVHAGGDATGAEISRALVAALEAVRDDPGIEVIEHALVLDVLTGAPDRDGRPGPACGVSLHVIGEGSRDGVGAALGARRGARHRRHRPGVHLDHQPPGGHRGRLRRGLPRRRRAAPTWSSCSSTRPCCGSAPVPAGSRP